MDKHGLNYITITLSITILQIIDTDAYMLNLFNPA